MPSPYFTEEHEIFRQSVRQFVDTEVRPNAEKWEREQRIDHAIWRRMGELGLLGINHPEKYGGAEADFFFSVVFLEEIGRAALGGFAAAVGVQQYMATAHLARAGSETLRQNYLAPSIRGEKVGALAITEPDTGSDVGAIRTRAERDGDAWLLNGSKTFITNGFYGDFVTVAAKTDPSAGTAGISLFVVESCAEGFTARKLPKLGWHCSDTAELAFANVRVPAGQLIGDANMGFYYLMESFQLERLVAAVQALGGADYCLEITLRYLNERKAFGRPLASLQTLRHTLADLAAELEAARQLTYHTCWLHDRGEQIVKQASMAKLLTSELGKKIADTCLQMFGGYGFMAEYEISRMYRDARAGTIAGGTSEIMREIIAKMLIDQAKYDAVYEPGAAVDAAAAARDSATPSDSPATAQTAAAIVRSLPQRFLADKAGDTQAVVHLDLAGDGGGQFTVTIGKGACRVDEGLHGQASCVVKAKAGVYRDIELGKTNPQTAFMLGKIKVSNIPEMLKFTKLFRALTDT